jgi:hypothetical protein
MRDLRSEKLLNSSWEGRGGVVKHCDILIYQRSNIYMLSVDPTDPPCDVLTEQKHTKQLHKLCSALLPARNTAESRPGPLHDLDHPERLLQHEVPQRPESLRAAGSGEAPSAVQWNGHLDTGGVLPGVPRQPGDGQLGLVRHPHRLMQGQADVPTRNR